MSDYLLPEGMTLAAAGKAVTELLEVRNGRSSVGDRVIYDTFDGRLHEAGLLAAWRTAGCRWSSWLAIAPQRGRRFRSRPARCSPRTCPRNPPDGPAPAAARPCAAPGGRDPKPRAAVRRARLRAQDRVRMRLQQPALGRRRLRSRVHVVAVRGYDKALRRVGRTLADELGLEPTRRPLRRRGGGGVRGTAGRDADEDRGPGRGWAARRRRGSGRAEGAVRGDRGEHGRSARRSRQRVPARSAGGSAPDPGGPARVEGSLRTGPARALPRGLSVAAAGHRRRSRPGRVPARVRADAGTGARVDPPRPRRASRRAGPAPGERATPDGPRAALRADAWAAGGLGLVPRGVRARSGRRGGRGRHPDRGDRRRADREGVRADGADGRRDRRHQPAGRISPAPQAGQGAPGTCSSCSARRCSPGPWSRR